MECLCFKLEFGHLVPEIETRRQIERTMMANGNRRRQREKAKERKKEQITEQRGRLRQKYRERSYTEMDKSVKIFIGAGGKLTRPTVFYFCVLMSRQLITVTGN